jgi:tRNA threonylcarbamoyladenosine biosynthesis protein TsaB
MRILAIDTSTRAGGAAVLDGESVLSKVSEDSIPSQQGAGDAPGAQLHPNEEFSSKLFRYVDYTLQSAGIALPDIDVFAVVSGPGSFTGLRVGLAAVKAWSEVYGKPIAAIGGLEALAAQSQSRSGLIAAFADARRGLVYGAIFERKADRLLSSGDQIVVTPQEFIDCVSLLTKGEVGIAQVDFVSTATEILREAIAASSLRDSPVEKVSSDLAPWVGRLAYERALRGELVDALTLDANYVRRMDAEMYWKES